MNNLLFLKYNFYDKISTNELFSTTSSWKGGYNLDLVLVLPIEDELDWL